MIVLEEFEKFNALKLNNRIRILCTLWTSWHLKTITLEDGQKIPVYNSQDKLKMYDYALFPQFGVVKVMDDVRLAVSKSPVCCDLDEAIIKEVMQCYSVTRS